MKISILEKRENFKNVFVTTINSFIHSNSELLNNKKVSANYRYNRYLNIVYPENFSSSNLWSLIQDYRFNKSFIKRIIQNIYVWLAVKTPFEKLLSSSFMEFHELPIKISQCIFLPGSHSIRIIDFEKNICYVVAKPGALSSFLKADVAGRRGVTIAPKILCDNAKHGYYTENLISGVSIDRTNNREESLNTYLKIKSIMCNRYRESAVQVLLKTYIESLGNDLVEDIKLLSSRISSQFPQRIHKIIQNIEDILINYEDELILICDTHGDFQPGNMLVTHKNIWLIDWEYFARRSYFFDAIVLECNTRNSNNLSKRLEVFYESFTTKGNTLSWTRQKNNNSNAFYFFIFLMEELILMLREVSAPYIDDPEKVVLPKILEYEIFLKKIKKGNV